MLMTEGKTVSEILGFGNPIQAIKRLRDENGASVQDAKAALEDADFDIEKARRLLKERGQEIPRTREVRINAHIKGLEERKRFLREQFEEEIAYLDRLIAKERQKLASTE
jgi:DNA-binding transcriptional MerR regulator